MYNIGQKVLYGANGVCVIDGVTEKKIGRSKLEYYVLKPMGSSGSTLFIPTANETLIGKLRSVLTPGQIESALESSLPEEWEDDKQLRLEGFRNIIARADFSELISLIRTITEHARAVQQKGKRLHVADEKILKEAEKMVCEEIETVLGVDKEEAVKKALGTSDL